MSIPSTSKPSSRELTAPNGVVVVDKPRGPTSHDVVQRVRKAMKSRHVGHAGTLDPMATGVLVIAVGEATKLVPWLTADDKAYEATVRLGIETDTLDAEGREISRAPVSEELARAIEHWKTRPPILEAAIAEELARTSQTPPVFSAIRVDGQRAHELARAGALTSDLPARPVTVRALDIVGGRIETCATTAERVIEIDLRVETTKGYFVRALARDLSQRLHTVGHLTRLRRVRSGAFTVDEAVPIDEVSRDRLVSVANAAARTLPVTILDDEGVRSASFGRRVATEHMHPPHACPSAWLDGASRLVAIGEYSDGSGRVLRGFPISCSEAP